MILGLRTAIYRVGDLDGAKEWYSAVLGKQPYYDEPFYAGFDVGGFELGLQPREPGDPDPVSGEGVVAYWGVQDADDAYARLLELGATERGGVQDMGGGIRVATVLDPFGNVFGVIREPALLARERLAVSGVCFARLLLGFAADRKPVFGGGDG